MTRRLLNLFTALSLLLCVAVVVLWVRSYVRSDTAGREGDGVKMSLSLSRGTMMFAYSGDLPWSKQVPRVTWGYGPGPQPPPPVEWHYWSYKRSGNLSAEAFRVLGSAYREVLGFGYGVGTPTGYSYTIRIFTFPLWFATTLLAVLPAVRWSSLRRRRRASPENLCPACGYNLTGNVSGVCPECGKTAP